VTTWAERLAVGHAATATVIGAAGALGGLGAWWVPVAALAALVTLVAAAVAAGSRRRTVGLSRLAGALDPRAWERSTVRAA
jgi:hypothetical protein